MVAGDIINQGLPANGRILDASVEEKRLRTGGRVAVAGGVIPKRIKTVGYVAEASCKAKERIFTRCCVLVWITATRSGQNTKCR